MLRAAGAVIIGKTVTTEFATQAPGKTRNPHDPDHPPGGSSSGSAAAVAAGMVPLAIGSQTNGSVIRPAAFCGVLGLKPTHGLIPRHGMLTLSRTLDHVGLFARTVGDLALLAGQLVGYDGRDPDTRPRARIPFAEVAAEEPPLPPMLAFVKTPHWERADEETKEAFVELIEHLGDRVEEVELLPSAAEAWEWHRTIMEAEMAANLEREWEKGRERLSESLRAVISQTLLKKIGGGRVAAHEIMMGTPAIRNLIRENKVAQMYSAIQTGQNLGMQTLDQCLQDLVRTRQVHVDEARTYAANKDSFNTAAVAAPKIGVKP
jgi:Asp-tRNA(Asn)/Glu-tRNA(Gln) amidotransferase A subunit family amidase